MQLLFGGGVKVLGVTHGVGALFSVLSEQLAHLFFMRRSYVLGGKNYLELVWGALFFSAAVEGFTPLA